MMLKKGLLSDSTTVVTMPLLYERIKPYINDFQSGGSY